MEKLVFGDGEQIGVFDGERVILLESKPIRRYKEYAEERSQKDEWKYGGIYCTNGRRIFYGKDGKWKKIAETEKCLCLATKSTALVSENDDFFE